MAKIDYKTAPGNPIRAPKRKIPYVTIDGRKVGDTDLIIRLLKAKHGDPLDAKLTPEQRASAMVLQRLTEEHLYFAAAWLRWNDENSFRYVREAFKTLLPPVVGGLIMKKLRKRFLKNLWSQGMGRHTREEIIQFAKDDLQTISVLLGEKPFFLGDQPTSIDATMYGFLIQTLWVPWDGEVPNFTRSLPNLKSYCERMKARYWQSLG